MRKKNKIILRKCVGCNIIKSSTELLKVTKFYKTGEILINPDTFHFGRSVYVCYNLECMKNAIKKKRLQKTLKKEISDKILKELCENSCKI